MSITVSQRNEVLRHLGYPIMGSPQTQSAGPPYTATFGQAGGMLGFRYFEFYALLVYRLNNLAIEEEVALFGPGSTFFSGFYTAAKAQINIVVPVSATPGDTITAQINGAAASYTLIAGDTAATISVGLELSINAQPVISPFVVSLAVANKAIITARTPGFMANSLALQTFVQGSSLTASTTIGDGVTTTSVLNGGSDPPGPVFYDPSQQLTMPYFGYMPIIRFWESQIPLASAGMKILKADVFHQRQDELAARVGGYQLWCKRLAQWAGVPYRGAGSFDGAGPRHRES